MTPELTTLKQKKEERFLEVNFSGLDYFLSIKGFANAPLDTCYHQACDTTENIDQTVYLQFAQAAATVLGKLAMQPDLNAFLGRTFPTTGDFQHETRLVVGNR